MLSRNMSAGDDIRWWPPYSHPIADLRIAHVGQLCGASTMALGALALAGRAAGVESLSLGEFAELPLAKPVTALALMLAGASLWLRLASDEGAAAPGGPRKAVRAQGSAAQALNLAVLLLVGDMLLFRLTGSNSGLADGLYRFVDQHEAAGGEAQMSLLGGLCLAGITSAQLLLGQSRPRAWQAGSARALCLAVLLGGMWAIVGFVFRFEDGPAMGANTAAACLLLGFGTLLLKPPTWLAETIFENGPAGRLARLLPLVLCIPVQLGAFLLHFEMTGQLNQRLAIELLVLLITAGIGVTYWVALRFLLAIEVRSRIDHELAEQENRCQLIVDASPDGIVLTDPRGKIFFANGQAAALLGYGDGAELLGLAGADFIQDADGGQLPELLGRRPQGEEENRELHLRRRDGELVWVLATTKPLYSTSGRRQGGLAILVDITRLKTEEAERAKLQAHLLQSQKMEAIGTLAGGIAHDFNNILTAILGYTDLARQELHNPVTCSDCLQEVENAGKRAVDLVRQILTFSRRVEFAKQPVRPSMILREVRDLMRAALPSTISVAIHDDAPEAVVLIDPTQLHQVIMNLCSNAGHAMRATGGKLHLSLRTEDIDPAIVPGKHGLVAGPHVVLSVEDTGPGIPAENLERIFEPFFTTKGVGEGTGLGLATVHGIVKDAGGAISVYTELGKGTTFNVYLPREDKVSEIETTSVATAARGAGRVLFVDDEAPLVKMGSLSLTGMGYTVTPFMTPVEAYEAFARDPAAFDVVVTDQTMPGMTGLQLAEQLRALRPQLPVVVCSGLLETAVDGLPAAGPTKFVLKPYSSRTLHEAIQTVVGGQAVALAA